MKSLMSPFPAACFNLQQIALSRAYRLLNDCQCVCQLFCAQMRRAVSKPGTQRRDRVLSQHDYLRRLLGNGVDGSCAWI